MAMINGNNGKVAYWLLGILAPTLLGGVTGWVTSTSVRLAHHGEHLAVLESQIKDTREELQRINQKLDRLLERRSP
jgi:hypothetical protein